MSRERLLDFPVCLQLAGKRVLVVGAGQVAARRIQALLTAGASITVVAPRACDEVISLGRAGLLRWEQRAYEPADCRDVRVVFVATDEPQTNAAVAIDANLLGALVNVADDPAHCDFTMPAVHREGELCVAVSSHGKSPRESARVRDAIAAALRLTAGRLPEEN